MAVHGGAQFRIAAEHIPNFRGDLVSYPCKGKIVVRLVIGQHRQKNIALVTIGIAEGHSVFLIRKFLKILFAVYIGLATAGDGFLPVTAERRGHQVGHRKDHKYGNQQAGTAAHGPIESISPPGIKPVKTCGSSGAAEAAA